MKDWDQVLLYKNDVDEICGKLASRMGIELLDDVKNFVYIGLKEKVDPSGAEGSERDYVRGAIWNLVQMFYKQEKRYYDPLVPIENLNAAGVQIDERGNVRWPPHKRDNSGESSEDE